MSKKIKNVVCLGGGTGLSVLLSGLKKYPINLSAIVTVFDNGGSSGKLSQELGILPVGDIRQCLLSLANKKALTNFFHYRFQEGRFKGHNLGNLLIGAANKMTGNLETAIEKIGKILNIKGKVFPVTFTKANLKAILKNNELINGEEAIINCPYLSKVGLKKLFLEPKVQANPKALWAIKNADLIIIAPGKFYTSILPHFLVKGIPEAVRKSRAKKVFICNLMTQVGNTDGFSVEDFLKILEKYLGKNVIDYTIFNTGKLSASQMKKVRRVFPKADYIKYDESLLTKKNFIGADLIDRQIGKLDPADILVKGANKRTMVFHQPEKLAKIILKLCRQLS